NGGTLAKQLAAGADRLLADRPTREVLIARIYQRALGRLPTASEAAACGDLLGVAAVPRADGGQDLLWAVAMRPEFQLISSSPTNLDELDENETRLPADGQRGDDRGARGGLSAGAAAGRRGEDRAVGRHADRPLDGRRHGPHRDVRSEALHALRVRSEAAPGP